MKGGYQIIDLEGRKFEPAIGQLIEGIYDLIEGTTKPIMISNFNVAGVEQHDFFAQVTVSGSSYVISTPIQYAKTITIQDTDVVLISSN